MCPPASVRVGIDVVDIDEVAASIRAHGDRYLSRVYTPRELDETAAADEAVTAAGLAARFAAKEAVLKVLRPEADTPAWLQMELRREPGGAPTLALGPDARRLADAAHLEGWSVSVAHGAGVAVAVVVADRRAT